MAMEPAAVGTDDMTTTGWYVYGIVDSDVEVTDAAHGIGDPPAPVDQVVADGVAALVSEIPTGRPLGSVDDLLAHQRLLDAVVTEAPVLPVRFGAVLDSAEAVAAELLEPHDDEFREALDRLRDTSQYVVRARYHEPAVINEVLDENRTARRLREQIAGQPEEATQDLRIQLGELVSQAIEVKRSSDTQAVLELATPLTVATAVRDPSHELDAAHVAVLVSTGDQEKLINALRELARQWADRAEVRLLGPMAPYDFVVAGADAGGG